MLHLHGAQIHFSSVEHAADHEVLAFPEDVGIRRAPGFSSIESGKPTRIS